MRALEAGKVILRWNKRRRSSRIADEFGLKGDMEIQWGDGVEPRVVHLFIGLLNYGCMHYNFVEEKHVVDPSFLKQLDDAGFDLTTLRLSIKKKR